MDRAGRVTGRPAQCTKYLDALEDLDLLSAKEMRVVFEKSERDLVPLDEHVERLTASRNLLAARLREVEDEAQIVGELAALGVPGETLPFPGLDVFAEFTTFRDKYALPGRVKIDVDEVAGTEQGG